jgi:hypothetical protein
MVRNTMSYSLGAAAAATGLKKTSILRAIESGKISGTKDVLGQWWVEPAELQRVPKLAREHVRLVPDKIYPGMWRVVGPSGTLRYGQQTPGTGCGLASSRIHGLDPHLGSLSGCRSGQSKSCRKRFVRNPLVASQTPDGESASGTYRLTNKLVHLRKGDAILIAEPLTLPSAVLISP